MRAVCTWRVRMCWRQRRLITNATARKPVAHNMATPVAEQIWQTVSHPGSRPRSWAREENLSKNRAGEQKRDMQFKHNASLRHTTCCTRLRAIDQSSYIDLLELQSITIMASTDPFPVLWPPCCCIHSCRCTQHWDKPSKDLCWQRLMTVCHHTRRRLRYWWHRRECPCNGIGSPSRISWRVMSSWNITRVTRLLSVVKRKKKTPNQRFRLSRLEVSKACYSFTAALTCNPWHSAFDSCSS